MNDVPENAPEGEDREAARRKLMGRAVLVGFVMLIAVYAVFTWLGRR